jgi:ribonuclease P protein component
LRIKKGWEYDLVFRTGFRLHGELVRLLCLEAEGPTRFGFAVGKRQGKAHVRSRGKRVLREAARRLLPWIRPRMRIVASLRDEGMKATADKIYFDMAKVLSKHGFFRLEWPGASWE